MDPIINLKSDDRVHNPDSQSKTTMNYLKATKPGVQKNLHDIRFKKKKKKKSLRTRKFSSCGTPISRPALITYLQTKVYAQSPKYNHWNRVHKQPSVCTRKVENPNIGTQNRIFKKSRCANKPSSMLTIQWQEQQQKATHPNFDFWDYVQSLVHRGIALTKDQIPLQWIELLKKITTETPNKA